MPRGCPRRPPGGCPQRLGLAPGAFGGVGRPPRALVRLPFPPVMPGRRIPPRAPGRPGFPGRPGGPLRRSGPDRDGAAHVDVRPQAGVGERAGQPAGADRLGDARIGQRRLQGFLHLALGLRAERLPRPLRQPPGLLGQRRDQPAALPGQLPQPVPREGLLCLPQRGAELQQLIHLAGVLADEQVHQPGAHRRPAQLPDRGREIGVPGRACLRRPLVAGRPERGAGERVQLVRHLGEVPLLHRPRWYASGRGFIRPG